MEKWGILGLKRPKKYGLDWQQGYGRGALVKAPKEKQKNSGKVGNSGGKWGKMGKTVGNFGCPMEKWGILELKTPKNMVLVGSKAMVGVHWSRLPRRNGVRWGKVGGNGRKWGKMRKFGMLDGKIWGIWGLKRSQNMVLMGNNAIRGGGGCIGESSQGKIGGNGEKWEKMGKPNQSTLAPHFLLSPPISPISPNSPPFPPFPPSFPPISLQFPPFPPIFSHFSCYWVHFGYVAGYITSHLVRVFLRPVEFRQNELSFFPRLPIVHFDSLTAYMS